ncbi:hypothetical protein E4U21_007070 [Claviceps maximensis]|nr:hypothetical protein E4U21_007070 [Claviceps maximensis]
MAAMKVAAPPDQAAKSRSRDPLDQLGHGIRGIPYRYNTRRRERRVWPVFNLVRIAIVAFVLSMLPHGHGPWSPRGCHGHPHPQSSYGRFPHKDDPFRFIPCTLNSTPPALDDSDPEHTWATRFDADPRHWHWGNVTTVGGTGHSGGAPLLGDSEQEPVDPYAGRGIYLCGYLDVPLDYTNKSDARIVRLAVTKYQVSGLAWKGHQGSQPSKGHYAEQNTRAGTKSERTIVVEPGGPGGSGTSMAWRSSEQVTKRLSDGKYDVLGWDPRGVNMSQPAIACFPHDVDRDHWSVRLSEFRESSPSPRAQLEFADVMNDSIFAACKELHGDIPRFLSTAFVARDLEEIRKALREDDLTGYLVSYGTGIGQTYSSMFPNSVGRMILDGTEYVRDQRMLGGFGWAALDNATDAWHDGFLGECVNAGADHCALAKPYRNKVVTLGDLQERMEKLVQSLIARPIRGYTKSGGPTVITYTALVSTLYSAMYSAKSWPLIAHMLADLEAGNSTLTAQLLDRLSWEYDPTEPASPSKRPSTDELGTMVICTDQYDAPQPKEGIAWYNSLWANMTRKSWIAGDSRFMNIFPCRHFSEYWPRPAEVFRGDLNVSLRNPVLLIAETYDPATPLRNGRRLLQEMGSRNARLIVHHGYGHSSVDTSSCTDAIAKAFILEGKLPAEPETACYANEKPYLYGVKKGAPGQPSRNSDSLKLWDEHIRELAILNPRLLQRR